MKSRSLASGLHSRKAAGRFHLCRPQLTQRFVGEPMKVIWIKIATIAIFTLAVALVMVFQTTPKVASASSLDDPAAVYKAKCAMCHGQKAEKFYDAAMPEADQVNAILKGKKGEKPPYMPSFEAKGITEDDAKALAGHMKTLKSAN